MSYLKQLKYQLPNIDSEFNKLFLSFLRSQGELSDNIIVLNKSQENFLPSTSFEFTDISVPTALFVSDNSKYAVEIKNTTRVEKQSPHKYVHIKIEDFIERLSNFKMIGVDHTGFNLPYFNGIHPEILKLRELFKSECLYHEFPKKLVDAPWDFILPATKREISGEVKTNYQITRKPKIEIVSFDKASMPLMQIDVQLEGTYEDLLKIFPESIDDPDMRNMWVYIKNDFGLDICFVLNESQGKDWSHYFEGSRIK